MNSDLKFINKSDYIIILILLLLPLSIVALFYFYPSNNVYFQIKYLKNNKFTTEKYEPRNNKSIVIQGKIGNIVLLFDKEKGVKVASSTCPCQVCVNSGWSRNEAIVCIPNAVIVQPINKTSQEKQIDAITR